MFVFFRVRNSVGVVEKASNTDTHWRSANPEPSAPGLRKQRFGGYAVSCFISSDIAAPLILPAQRRRLLLLRMLCCCTTTTMHYACTCDYDYDCYHDAGYCLSVLHTNTNADTNVARFSVVPAIWVQSARNSSRQPVDSHTRERTTSG